METINSIKDDFQLIIVISHIEELKDQFGARIDVLKENHRVARVGSLTVRIVRQNDG